MFKKILPYFIVALVLALMLAACGGGTPEVDESTTEEQVQEAPAEEPTEAPAEEAPASDSGLPDLGGREVTIAIENAYLPFNYIDPDTGEPAGWDYDVWDEICNAIELHPGLCRSQLGRHDPGCRRWAV